MQSLLRPVRRVGGTSLGFRRYYAAEAQHDLVVVGGGPGGYVAAIKAAQLGLKVACVEGRGRLGGTCLNVGCIPSKALLNASHKYEEAKHTLYKDHGVKVEGVSVDLAVMMKNKESRVDGLTKGIEGLFGKNKVEYVKGWGTIKGPNDVSVALADGTSRALKTKNILIATGSSVANLPGITIDEKTIVSSTGALSLTEVPKKLVLIGGGVIGLEMGCVWSRLGSEVTVVEFTDRIAAGADTEVAKEFQKLLTRQGLKFKLNTKVTSAVPRPGGGVDVTIEDAAGGNTQKLDADVVLVAVGRRANIEGLGLKEAGVKYNERSNVVDVDDHFVTNVPSIRAIGDVIRGPMLAHKAEEEGIAAVENLVSGSGHVNYNAIPSVIYTWPEVAWVGKTEEELKKANIPYRVGKFPFKANSRARTNADTDGFVKFLTDAKTDKILGAHIIGPEAGNLIHEAVLGIEYEASAEDIARTCHAHPTLAEAVKEAAMAAFDKPIHF
eukprot:TRINITY_DN18453_c0_g1_i1.p1 TRINITY_DN18453_c0_g1~~TRINITY_DN18453_c0_g1_i1.p1  ORF type:complete len:495 (-),score=110.21 TRINITY_DN18453_c0_g1_i1:138-1622(-)